MSAQIRYLPTALAALDEIYDYTLEQWGMAQADAYVSGAFDFCGGLKARPRRKIPEALGVFGYYAVYRRHHIYWREAANGDVIVVCVVHSERDLPRHIVAAFAEAGDEA